MSVALGLPLWLLLDDEEHGSTLLDRFERIYVRRRKQLRDQAVRDKYQQRFGGRRRARRR